MYLDAHDNQSGLEQLADTKVAARVPTVYLDAQSVWSNWPIVTEATLRACQRSLDAANEDDTCASAA